MSLIVVLLLLVIVSLLGVASMQIVMMGERSARSDRDMQLAWQGAEAALVDAEIDLQGPNAHANSRTQKIQDYGVTVDEGCGTASDATVNGMSKQGLCSYDSGRKDANDVTIPSWLTVDFMDTSGSAQTVALGTFTGREFRNANEAAGKGIQPALAPRYVIEVIPEDYDPAKQGFAGQGGGEYQSAAAEGSLEGLGTLFRVTSIGFGPRSNVQAVLQTIYRN